MVQKSHIRLDGAKTLQIINELSNYQTLLVS